MRPFGITILVLITLSSIANAQTADTVYSGGNIYTVNDAQPWAEAVAIKDGKFLVVGSSEDVKAVIGDKTTVVDLGGKMAMPGLIDVHNHAMGASMGKANLYIKNPNDKDAILAEIKAYAEANPDLPYIRGESWNLGVFPDNSPRKELLDAIDSKRPIYFYSQTGHSAWVNSKALELIGINAETKQTKQFLWDVDPKTKEPTGTIREYAMAAMEQALDPVDPKRMAPALQGTLKMFSEYGYTSLMLEDYEGRPGFKGDTHLSTEEFIKEFKYFNSLGLGMIVHVFGDGSAVEAVTAFEAVRKTNGNNGIPLHFSHAVLTGPREINRLARIPDTSMDFLTMPYPHPSIEGSFGPPIGEKRYQTFLNVRSAEEAGIPYSFGTDWPASLEPIPNGFRVIQSFLTRRDPGNPDYGTLNADQAISLKQAVRASTHGGAECLGFDWTEKLGSIEKGKLADFIVLDRNIFEIPTETLKDTLVERTIVGGRVVFDRDRAEEKLEVVEIEITNKDLDNAVDAAELNLLVQDELYGGGCGCFGVGKPHMLGPGSTSAPDDVNRAFGKLLEKGYRFARHARAIEWKDDRSYWIQWTQKEPGTAVLWAYDPDAGKTVEILRVREE